jgi:hypothetical protein
MGPPAIRPAQPTQQHAQPASPEREAGGGTEQHALGNVAAMRVEIGTEVRAAVLQAREVAVRRVADRFLGVEVGRQRRRIGLLAVQPQVGEQRVERRMHLDRITHRLAGLRIEQAR